MILLVEDDRDDVFLMQRAMLKANLSFPMHNARDGQEALDYLQGTDKYSDRAAYPFPALILLDLKIPYVHGFEVLRWIKQQSALAQMPVVILTSSLEERDREQAQVLGANGFVVKPPTPEKLLQLFQAIPGFSPSSAQ
jgi:CheY-like chemotaxis protein